MQLADLPDDLRVSVVIPARNETATLPAAVRSVARQRGVDEIIIAAADEATRSLATDLAGDDQRIQVVDNPAGGTSSALNAGVAASSGHVIVRVDAHAELPDGYVERAVRRLRATGAANVGGKQVPQADSGFARAVAAAMRSRLGSGGAAYRSSSTAGPVDTVYLGVYRREVFDLVGGFDERFVRNQDAELNERLRAAGLVVWFDPELEVIYRPRGSLQALASQYWGYGRWRRATAKRHPGSLRIRQLAPPALIIGGALVAGISAATATLLPLLAGAGAYVVVLCAAGVASARHPIVGLRAALALGTMHIAWGLGFLAGPPMSIPRRFEPPSPR